MSYNTTFGREEFLTYVPAPTTLNVSLVIAVTSFFLLFKVRFNQCGFETGLLTILSFSLTASTDLHGISPLVLVTPPLGRVRPKLMAPSINGHLVRSIRKLGRFNSDNLPAHQDNLKISF